MYFWPLARSKNCVSVRGFLDKFFTHLALVGSGDGVLVIFVVDGVVEIGVAFVAMDVVMFDCEVFEWPL